MKKTLLIMFLFALSIAEVIQAGSPEKKWVKELREKLESDGSVLLYWECDHGWRDCNCGGNYYIPATRKQISDSPVWNTNSLLPPLSLEKAITIAQAELKQKNPDYDQFRLSQASLSLISGIGINREKWWYFFNYHGTSQIRHDRSFLICVLMDGTALKPCIVEHNLKTWTDKDKVLHGKMTAKEDDAIRKDIEKRLAAIIVPEIDFRQANIFDVVDDYNHCVAEYGTGAEKKEETRLQIRLHESAIIQSCPPYALPIDAPLLAFSCKDVSLLEVLKITVNVLQLKMHMEGNVVTLYNPKN
ncbi:MAG: hypothetical protein PHI84_02190 [Kiritimatiellae bacterium]|nr:hypothetical protein [Kiritimatiellia bacterium]